MTRTLSKHTITFIWWQITGHTQQEQTTGTYHWVYQMIHLIPGKFFTCCRPWWISRGSTADDAASRPSATSPFQCSTWQTRQQSTRARLSSVPMQLPQSIFSNSIHHRHCGRCGSSVLSCSQLFQSQPLPHPFTSSFCVASHTTKTLRWAAHVWKLDHNLHRVATLFRVHTLLQLCKPGWPRPCMLHSRRRWAASGRIRNRCSYRWRDPN